MLEIPVDAQIWMGPGRHFVHYYVQEGRLLNFVALIDQDTWTRESWTDRGDVADALAAYEGWHPQVRSILETVDETFIWALFDRAPLELWSKGRVTLLGDACHPMLPFMAQGAAQAIEDGAALTACLAQMADVPAALRRYEESRLPRTSEIQALSARQQDPLPPARRSGAGGARRTRWRRSSTDWSFKAVSLDLRPRRRDRPGRRRLVSGCRADQATGDRGADRPPQPRRDGERAREHLEPDRRRARDGRAHGARLPRDGPAGAVAGGRGGPPQRPRHVARGPAAARR